MGKRPLTTLFLLQSVDGRISTGSVDARDFDKDIPLIDGVRQGLGQYYDLESRTDLWSLNTGRVMAKIGVNDAPYAAEKTSVSFIIVDNRPHLTEAGVRHLSAKLQKLVIVTSNPAHPALRASLPNVEVMTVGEPVDWPSLMETLRERYLIDRLTIQSGGTLNAALLRHDCIDRISIVVAPFLVGGKDTPSLVDGPSFTEFAELSNLSVLELREMHRLEDGYIHLVYDVRRNS